LHVDPGPAAGWLVETGWLVGTEAKYDRAYVDTRRNRYRIPLFLLYSDISGGFRRNVYAAFDVVLRTSGVGSMRNRCLVAYHFPETIEI